MIKRVKGFQDWLDMSGYNSIVDAARLHLATAHFTQIQLPIIESDSLFHHSVGTETDIVTKEMYSFSVNGKETLCLRPEGTAGTMRAFFENNIQATPWNVFSVGAMFRHERPQKGRYRQFDQFNIECINITPLYDDVRLIVLLDDFFGRVLNITDYVLSINFLGSPADRARYKDVLKAFAQQHHASLCETCNVRVDKNILRILDCKNQTCQEIYTNAPILIDHLSEESAKQWQTLNDLLDILSINRVHNPFLVRGLDYYNNTVFEFSSPLLGAQSTFCGGGQYDLSSQLGHKQAVPAVGAAFGVERVQIVLEGTQNSILQTKQKPLHVIIPCSEEQIPLGFLTHQTLLRAGICSDLIAEGIKKGMKKANKMNADYTLLIGDEEQATGSIRIKNMATGIERLVSQEALVSELQLHQEK